MEKKIFMFTLSTCSHCKGAKKFFQENNIDFEYTDVDLLEGDEKASILCKMRELNPGVSFPTIIIGDRIIVGNKQDEFKKVLGL